MGKLHRPHTEWSPRTRRGDSVIGEVDVANVRHLRRELVLAVRDGERDVIVDLSATTYLDSAGLGALIGARRRLRASGRALHLVVSRDSLLSLLAITHLDRAFPIHASLAAALRTVQESPAARVR